MLPHGPHQTPRRRSAVVRRTIRVSVSSAPSSSAEHARGAARRTADRRSGPGRPHRRGLYARFVALTAVNPLTLATFSAVATGLPGNRTAPGPATPVTFVAGVALASVGWHAILAGASGLPGRRRPAAARTWTSIWGAALTLPRAAPGHLNRDRVTPRRRPDRAPGAGRPPPPRRRDRGPCSRRSSRARRQPRSRRRRG